MSRGSIKKMLSYGFWAFMWCVSMTSEKHGIKDANETTFEEQRKHTVACIIRRKGVAAARWHVWCIRWLPVTPQWLQCESICQSRVPKTLRGARAPFLQCTWMQSACKDRLSRVSLAAAAPCGKGNRTKIEKTLSLPIAHCSLLTMVRTRAPLCRVHSLRVHPRWSGSTLALLVRRCLNISFSVFVLFCAVNTFCTDGFWSLYPICRG